MTPPGFNPMRWQCRISGCFNIKCRPKTEHFADCFPGRINFGDIDGMVEIGGFFLLLEWKNAGGALRYGQQLSYSAFTKLKTGNAVVVVEGNAETMTARRYLIYWCGTPTRWHYGTLAEVKYRIERWAAWAGNQRRIAALKASGPRVVAFPVTNKAGARR